MTRHSLPQNIYQERNFFKDGFIVAGREKIVKEAEKIDFSKREDEKWKRRSLPAAGKVQGNILIEKKLVHYGYIFHLKT